MSKAKAVVLTVNYKSADSVLAFLESLECSKALRDIEVVVVDNSAGQEQLCSIQTAVGKCTNVELISSGTNRGYFGGAKTGIDEYLREGREFPDWVIVCNHDILIEDKDFFRKLFRQDPKTVGVVAPCIQSLPGNLDQN